jgi:hypothetical protein
MADTSDEKTPGQLAKPTTSIEPHIKVEISKPDERGERVANVLLLITDPAEFNASIGAESDAFSNGVLSSVSLAAQCGAVVDEKQANFALSIVRGLHPRDQVETMLGTQVAAIHLATMRTAAKLGSVKNPQFADQHERAMNRLARTFAAQVEALKRYRSKGEQRVYVERVTLNEGGQAIVGPVTHAGRGGGSEEIDG